jgi:hypothetical protein
MQLLNCDCMDVILRVIQELRFDYTVVVMLCKLYIGVPKTNA